MIIFAMPMKTSSPGEAFHLSEFSTDAGSNPRVWWTHVWAAQSHVVRGIHLRLTCNMYGPILFPIPPSFCAEDPGCAEERGRGNDTCWGRPRIIAITQAWARLTELGPRLWLLIDMAFIHKASLLLGVALPGGEVGASRGTHPGRQRIGLSRTGVQDSLPWFACREVGFNVHRAGAYGIQNRDGGYVLMRQGVHHVVSSFRGDGHGAEELSEAEDDNADRYPNGKTAMLGSYSVTPFWSFGWHFYYDFKK